MESIKSVLTFLLVAILDPSTDVQQLPCEIPVVYFEGSPQSADQFGVTDELIMPYGQEDVGSYRPDTIDYRNPTPRIRTETGLIMWGAEENHLYYSWNGLVWKLACSFEHVVHRLFPINDTTVGIWDGRRYYAYTVGADSAMSILPEGPLHDFLKYPIRTIAFVGEGLPAGRIHSVRGTEYPANGIGFMVQNGVLVPSDEFKVQYEGDYPVLRVDDLFEALRALSSDVDSLPDLKDFNITPDDIQLFHQKVDKLQHHYLDKFVLVDSLRFDSKFYHQVPELLDTLSRELFDSILSAPVRVMAHRTQAFAVAIVNENNDTIGMLGDYTILMPPWGLPWRVETEMGNFYTWSIDFSRFIDGMLSENIKEKPMFSNIELMMRIGDYLYYGL